MSDIKPHDIIKDNDPRTDGRLLEVVEVGDRYIYAVSAVLQRPPLRKHRILKNRIHTDGKLRRSGFSLVEGAEL